MGFFLRITKQRLKFSAAHFTLFQEGRERLHGHNYTVGIEVMADHMNEGFLINFSDLKDFLMAICHTLDEKFLLPESPRITHRIEAHTLFFQFENEEFSMPLEDVMVLPIENITCEALALYFFQKLQTQRERWDPSHCIKRVRLWIEETPGQCAGVDLPLDD